jgi:sec-independent protein translocase protein TatB
MFDVSFVELMVIGVVALLVLGPERLPGAARTFGTFLRKARQGWTSVRTEFERQMAVEDVKRSVREVRDSIDGTAKPAAAERSVPAPALAAGPAVPLPGATPAATQAPHD